MSGSVVFQYHSGKTYNYEAHFSELKQNGQAVYSIIIQERSHTFQAAHRCEPVLNEHLQSMCVAVFRFIPTKVVPLSLFGNDDRKGKFRQILYYRKQNSARTNESALPNCAIIRGIGM
ncbi:hypothetical protein [Spirosoma aerophilum]